LKAQFHSFHNISGDLSNFLFLFDIDGTILDSGGDGKRAFMQAFAKITGISIEHEISFLGGIDNVLFREIYLKHDLPENKMAICFRDFESEYFSLLSEFSNNDSWRVYPGAENTIRILHSSSNIALATGNLVKGAKIKLGKFGLDSFFRCGGYGDTAKVRSEIVRDAITCSNKLFNKNFDNKNIFLFGDTKKDVDSAIENQINPVLVDANKRYIAEKKNPGVDYFTDFSGIENILKNIK
jgi:phosphoglycolate phosphatase